MSVAFESTAAAPAPVETQTVTTPVVACDGGNGGLGHPRVFLNIAHERQGTCPYCSRHFVLAAGVKAGGH